MASGVLALATLTLIGGAQPNAAYYVSPTGDDANPGTIQRPWRTIERVNKANLRPGECVSFEGGHRYAGTIALDSKDSGAPKNSVVISSYGVGRAIIDGGSESGIHADGCDYLTVENIDFAAAGRENNDGYGIYIANCKGAAVTGSDIQGFRLAGLRMRSVKDARITHVRAHENGATGIGVGGDDKTWSENVYIAHCVTENNAGDPRNLHNHSGNGIVVGSVRDCLIEYCESMNNGWDMPRDGNGPVGIWAWNADRVLIQFCIAHDNKSPGYDGGGFDIDGGVTNSILQYNLSYNNDGPGYFFCQYPTAPAWKDNIARYNISQNDGSKGQKCGIMVAAWEDGMADARIYNNTVFNTQGAAIAFEGKKVPGVLVQNNIFVSATEVVSGDTSATRFERNLYWMLAGKKFKVDGTEGIKAWSEATGQETQDGALLALFANPRLVRPGSAACIKPADLAQMPAYKLEPDSPCIGAGIPIEHNGGRDFWGNALSDKTPSIGACERP